MRTKGIFLKSMIVFATAGMLFTGCRREDEDNDTSSASDNAFAEASFNDITAIADQASYGSVNTYRTASGDQNSLLSACATVTHDSANASDVDSITINFGTTNCQCLDGRYRRGIIRITYAGGNRYRDSGLVATITPVNYFVNDNGIAGTKTIENKGHITAGKLTWVISVNGTITLANGGGTVTWNSNRTKVLLAGETTYGGPINWSVAKWQLTGSANGTAANGENFTAQIDNDNPLVRDMTCNLNRRHIVAGKMDFTPGNRPTRHIDFGTGTCDDLATVTINNNTYTIHMR
ncbi:MAG: hypothetical protein AB1458_12700 [Bacteroidota bacterium]